MAEEDKCIPKPLFCRDLRWDPLCGWPRQSRIFDQDFGMPPFPAPCDQNWAASAGGQLGGSSWPGYRRAPLPSSQTPLHPSANPLQPLPAGASEILTGQDTWQVNLDVNQFSPEEISIKTREGYLEIIGKHEERQDEHGFISRYFTRKYRLPAGMDLQRISSTLSGDGVLSVQGPLPAPSVSAETVVPIQVERRLEAADSTEKGDQVDVDIKTEETKAGEESEEKKSPETEGLESLPAQPASDAPEGGANPQRPPVVQPESSLVEGEELRGDSSEVMVAAEKEVPVSLAEEVPAQPEGDATVEQVDPKLAQEHGDAGKELEEASHQDKAASDVAMEGRGEPSDSALMSEIQQDPSGEPVQASSEPTSGEEPQPAPSQEAKIPDDEAPIPKPEGPSPEQEVPVPEQEDSSSKKEGPGPEEEAPVPEQDAQVPEQDSRTSEQHVSEQQEVEHAEFPKGPPEF